MCLPGAAQSLISVQGKAVRGSQSTPADTQLHQSGDRSRPDVEEPQTTHPGSNVLCTLQIFTPNNIVTSSVAFCVFFNGFGSVYI